MIEQLNQSTRKSEKKQVEFYRFLVGVQACQTIKDTPKIEVSTELLEKAIVQIVKVASQSDADSPV